MPIYSDESASPKIIVLQPTYDAGIVCPHEIVKHDFVVKNIGDADLEYCRSEFCTGLSKKVKVLEPGKEASIHVESWQRGNYSEKYQTNDPDNPTFVLQIKKREISFTTDSRRIECVEGVALEPQKFNIKNDCQHGRDGRSMNPKESCQDFTIFSIKDSSGYVTWEMHPEIGIPVEQSESYILTLASKSGIPYGRYEGELVIKHNGIYCPKFTLKYTIDNHHRVEIIPTELKGYMGYPLINPDGGRDIGYFDKPVIWITTYYVNEARSFEITDMICDIDVLKPEYKKFKNSGSIDIYLIPIGDYKNRKGVSGTLTIKTNDSLYSEFVIPIDLKKGVNPEKPK